MKPTRNIFKSFFADAETSLQEIFYDKPMAWVDGAREKMKDLPKTNFDLGCKFAEEGLWRDALFRFRVALYLNPAYPQARYNLGCCYYRLGQIAKAKAELKQVLREQPGHADAVFMLASIDPQALPANQRPQAMPQDLVTKFFTSIAENYTLAEADNKYRGGVLVAEQVKPYLPTSDITVVDLGCGTGISGIPLRGMAREMIGIDVTPAMTEQAALQVVQDKKLYDRVVTADITALGEEVPAEYADLVLLVNVVQFVGALQGVLHGAARLLKTRGVLAITVEPYKGNDGFGIVAGSGRFGHNPAYVKHVAEPLGLTQVKEIKLSLYPGTDATLLIFQKGI